MERGGQSGRGKRREGFIGKPVEFIFPFIASRVFDRFERGQIWEGDVGNQQAAIRRYMLAHQFLDNFDFLRQLKMMKNISGDDAIKAAIQFRRKGCAEIHMEKLSLGEFYPGLREHRSRKIRAPYFAAQFRKR